MVVVTIDGNGAKNLDDVVKLKFVAANNSPINEKVIVDDSSSVSSIAGINTIRATVGIGDGSSGWVKVSEVSPSVPTKEVHVQLSKVTSFSILDNGEEFAVLKRNGVMLGEVHNPTALAKVKSLPIPH
jgi:hypothetical protein